MTRAEAYAAGFSEGCRWAEQDIRDGASSVLRFRTTDGAPDWYRANEIGYMRGYRDTFRRFEAGTLTYAMFENERESPREPMRRGTR